MSYTKKKQGLSVPDMISVGVFTALYFVIVTIATFSSGVLFAGFGYVLLPAWAALLSGSIYMLITAKVQKFGAITIMGVVMGLFFFVSGHFVLSFAANIVCGVAADLVAKAFDYRNKKGILLSYIIFSFGLTGPVLPMWFMKSAYVANLESRGKDAEFINNMFAHISMGSFALAVVAIVVCAAVGGLFGEKMMKKHFEKAGIIG